MDSEEQVWTYDGHKKRHAFSVIVFCDVVGAFPRIEITDHGAEIDWNLFTGSEVYRNPEALMASGEHGMEDMGLSSDDD